MFALCPFLLHQVSGAVVVSGLLQATVLLTHTFLTLEMHSQAFHCAQVSLVKVH